jgi:hypothetical protein
MLARDEPPISSWDGHYLTTDDRHPMRIYRIIDVQVSTANDGNPTVTWPDGRNGLLLMTPDMLDLIVSSMNDARTVANANGVRLGMDDNPQEATTTSDPPCPPGQGS